MLALIARIWESTLSLWNLALAMYWYMFRALPRALLSRTTE